MTTDLVMLVATALLCIGIPFIYGAGRFLQPGGFDWAASNREAELNVPAWTQRAVRAHLNLVENLAPFAILVLVAHITGKSNDTTAAGAAIFFWARVAHLIVYVAGLKYVRTIAWFGGWAGGVMILMQLFK
ncbi:MAG: MAPEG family protein [Bradyrhizobium sp.]|uniref:MAPEG family protein n=1 Tax=Bradyrhizobium sp. TaxID=376 RepID=UPI001ECEADAF|nr:MAPEG family protein [Bradyrhizobium sp.]MBU6459194.1 MAPEG family protein [Bradyrhizobium sp.]MDE2604018.1 MAPEG family protein [Bradyrhizobium sp.]